MSETLREIESQPASWRTAAALASLHADALPVAGERVAVVGCGTSWFVAQAVAARRESLGRGETDAFTASEFPDARAYDRVVAISRSGTTTEIVRLLAGMPGSHGAPRTVVTAVAGSPVTAHADRAVVLDFADETSVVQTRFATSVLALFRAHLGEDLEPAIAAAERALVMPLPVDPTRFDHFVFLGAGWTIGLANEAALKLREACQAHTESYPAMEYRHGPVSLAGASTLVWILGSHDPGVADDVAATGATVRTAELEPMAELVLIHRTAVALASARGLDPDHPRHLTRSVVLS
jgi:fructoselysine-6-P-deglycase FrlB-like protein